VCLLLGMIKSRSMIRTGQIAHMEELRKAYRILVRKPELKSPFERPGRRWENNIKTYVKEIRYEGMGCSAGLV